MKKIKVITILTRMSMGGLPLQCATLGKGLDKTKYDHLFIHGSLAKSEGDMRYLIADEPNVLIPELIRELNIKQDLKAFISIYKLIKNYKPDVVHTHHSKAGILGRLAAKLCGVPVIIHTFHGNVFHGYFGKLKSTFFINVERFMSLLSTRIIAISKTQKEELLYYKIASAKKIEIIKLGFDFSKLIPEDDYTSNFRERFNIDKNSILVGSIGRIVPIKNHKMLVDIAEKVLEKSMRKVQFVIVGEGQERENIAKYIADKNLQSSFVFTGHTQNLKEIYHEIDIVALTSLNEGTPVAIIEAMVNRKLVFSTNVGGVADFVENQKSGFFFEVDDVTNFANKLSEVINNFDSPEYQPIKDRAHDIALENFSLPRLIKEIDYLYSHLLRNKTQNF